MVFGYRFVNTNISRNEWIDLRFSQIIITYFIDFYIYRMEGDNFFFYVDPNGWWPTDLEKKCISFCMLINRETTINFESVFPAQMIKIIIIITNNNSALIHTNVWTNTNVKQNTCVQCSVSIIRICGPIHSKKKNGKRITKPPPHSKPNAAINTHTDTDTDNEQKQIEKRSNKKQREKHIFFSLLWCELCEFHVVMSVCESV